MPDFELAISRCLEAACDASLWPSALSVLAAATGSRGVLITQPKRNHAGIIYSPTMDDAIGLFFEEEWHLRDFRSDRTIVRGLDQLTADQHIIQPDDIGTSEYYRGFARRADVSWFAAFGTQAADGAMIGMSIQRRHREGAFDNSELESLRRAAPELRQALLLAHAVRAHHEQGILRGLELVDQAALLMGFNGILVAANSAAEALMGTGIRRSARSIAAVNPADRIKLEQYIASACSPDPRDNVLSTSPIALNCEDGGVLVVQAAPVVGIGSEVFGNGRCVMLLNYTGRPRAPSPAILAEAFGLTATEAKVGSLLALGLPVKRVAEQLDMSEAAVRYHIKSILPKAQVRGQAQFAAAVGRLSTRKLS
jgi:DNA-binding CsgD family transcriptional regulator